MIAFKGGATFSPCQRYRYWLERQFEKKDGDVAVFAMLNPSTATAEINDPTIRRCMGFATQWGCKGLVVVNIFGFRATDPAAMKAESDPVGPENDQAIREALLLAAVMGGPFVCAWGTHGGHQDRDRRVMQMIEQFEVVTPMTLGLTADGSPRHPLYLRSDSQLVPYRGRR